MRILGIDYGRRKIGLAIADGPLAEPLKMFRYSNFKDLIKKIRTEIEGKQIEKIVIGISEGEMAKETKHFALAISQLFSDIKVETSDETLTTQDAQVLSKEAGIKRKKRHEMEDAYAATIMLQKYLDF